MLAVGELVISVGESWSEKYLGKLFLITAFIDTDEFGRKWRVVDHISGGSLLLYEDEVEKVAA